MRPQRSRVAPTPTPEAVSSHSAKGPPQRRATGPGRQSGDDRQAPAAAAGPPHADDPAPMRNAAKYPPSLPGQAPDVRPSQHHPGHSARRRRLVATPDVSAAYRNRAVRVHRSVAQAEDLHRDGRYAMHSFPLEDNEDDGGAGRVHLAPGSRGNRSTSAQSHDDVKPELLKAAVGKAAIPLVE